jgi:isopentenyl-diphosphate delta-isomerase
MEKQRKNDHIHIALNEIIESSQKRNGFEHYEFEHCAFPSIHFNDIDTQININEKKLTFPFMITALTGGSERAGKINKILAGACQKFGIALGLGSQKVLFSSHDLLSSYQIREEAPDVFLLGNLGIHHLKEFGIEKCAKMVEDIHADGLALYLNPLHEVSQEKGTPDYCGLKEILIEFCNSVTFPVIIKETGHGISASVVKYISDTGIFGIDVAGAGGTSCVMLEYYLQDNNRKEILKPFFNWGIPTAKSLRETRKILPETFIIASGGLRNGVDCAKSIALGANMAGMALPFLRAASISSGEVEELILKIIEQFKISMFCTGAKNIKELSKAPLKEVIYERHSF